MFKSARYWQSTNRGRVAKTEQINFFIRISEHPPGADKSAVGAINRPLQCPDARLPTTNSYTRHSTSHFWALGNLGLAGWLRSEAASVRDGPIMHIHKFIRQWL